VITYTVKVNDYGTKFWYLNDKRHREDGPAVECANGSKFWYLNGKLHRKDGPATERTDGRKEWWIDGKQLTEAEFLRQTGKSTSSCNNKIVEIDGKKYRLTEV
jgi:hypothetical protein